MKIPTLFCLLILASLWAPVLWIRHPQNVPFGFVGGCGCPQNHQNSIWYKHRLYSYIRLTDAFVYDFLHSVLWPLCVVYCNPILPCHQVPRSFPYFIATKGV